MKSIKAIFCLMFISWSTLAQIQPSKYSSALFRAVSADSTPIHLVTAINWNLPQNR